MVSSKLFSSGQTEWRTPLNLVKLVHEVAYRLSGDDEIGLDPCGHPKALLKAAVQWCGPAHGDPDGLVEDWDRASGMIYVNPPYGRELPKWVERCAKPWHFPVVLLVPARTDTRWWHQFVVPHAAAICFWRGRLKFVGAESSAPFPSAVIYFAHAFGGQGQFIDVFKPHGWVVDPSRITSLLGRSP